MCGIAGFIDFTNRTTRNDLIKITDTLHPRGPDDSGYEIFNNKNYSLGLGHRRLSIIDLSINGHQPMVFLDLTIVFNGVIYNYIELRKELEKEGYIFQSASDTEVILKAWHKWGYACLDKFRGMWAFAIWDKNKEELLLCRDRFGVKPLHWYYRNGVFLFASEIKAFYHHSTFIKEINPDGLSLFFQYSYVSAPHTIFKNTYKLEPGHCLTINKKGDIKNIEYWNPDFFYNKGYSEKKLWDKKNEIEVEKELSSILIEAFKLRMVADVPIGIFLSGGIDSSLLTALLQNNTTTPLNTFTVGFSEKEYNEAHFAKKVSTHLGTHHTEIHCTPYEVIDLLSDLYSHLDEPFGDSSLIPTYLISKMARTKVKVCLSADGGDEQFCGYKQYLFSKKKIENSIGFKNAITLYDESLKHLSSKEINRLGLNSKINQKPKIKNQKLEYFDQMMLYDTKLYLPDDILTKVDRASMLASLEVREPFLDNKIVEYSAQLPLRYKYRDGISKYILKKIISKYIPKEIIDRPKQGFGIPIFNWLKDELKPILNDCISLDSIKKDGIFNWKQTKKSLDLFNKKQPLKDNFIWLLYVFQQWKTNNRVD